MELGWVQRLHEAFARGEIGRLHQWLLGVQVHKDCWKASRAHPEGGKLVRRPQAPDKFVTKRLQRLGAGGDPDQVSAPLRGEGGCKEGMLMAVSPPLQNRPLQPLQVMGLQLPRKNPAPQLQRKTQAPLTRRKT